MAARNWMLEEFERASARFDKLPDYAKPVITKPMVSARAKQDADAPAPKTSGPRTS